MQFGPKYKLVDTMMIHIMSLQPIVLISVNTQNDQTRGI